MGRISTGGEHIIMPPVNCSTITITFSEEESAGVKAVLFHFPERHHMEWVSDIDYRRYKLPLLVLGIETETEKTGKKETKTYIFYE